MPPSTPIKMHPAGCGGLLFDPGQGVFDMTIQQRLWALKDQLDQTRPVPGLQHAALGMNNLLLLFDPLELDYHALAEQLPALWRDARPLPRTGREFVIPVSYGGVAGEDLAEVCERLSLSPTELVALHTGATYTVACLGSMPGFAYLAGLPPKLALPRRAVPRVKVPRGTVMIGGAQAAIQPVTSPSGWNMLGTTDVELFDATATEPCLLRPGDRLRFEMRELLP